MMSARPDTSKIFETIMQQAMKGNSKDWWQSYHYPETVKFNPEDLINCARSALYSKALVGGTLYEENMDYFIGNAYKKLSNLSESLVKELNARLVYNRKCHVALNILFYVFDNGAIQVSYNNEILTIEALSLDKSKVDLAVRTVRDVIYE